MNKINVVLDLDRFITEPKITNKELVKFALKKGALINALHTHVIFPGVIEAMQVLFNDESIKVSFYSSGSVERNNTFVEELLTLALGEKGYDRVKRDLRVISKIVDEPEIYAEEQLDQFGIKGNGRKKDLREVGVDETTLDHTILIDDTPELVAYKQERNFLHAPELNESYYNKLKSSRKLKHFDGKEQCPIRYRLSKIGQDILDDQKTLVLNARTLQLVKVENDYKIYFLNNTSRTLEQFLITPKDYPELVAKIDSCDDSFVYDKEIINSVNDIVQANNGITHRISHRVNTIYYVMGLLFSTIEESKRCQKPVADILFSKQFRLKDDGKYALNTNYLSRVDDYYHYGLQKLRTVNPELQFLTPLTYKQCIEVKITEAEQKIIDDQYEARYRAKDDCIVM
ncbi:MAG: hypothetical protein JHC93_03715 [Parachlamydiales bacterium]|nr:hypothetical protein [Parachlamydiales bacterium]